jgi:hypothetical protein
LGALGEIRAGSVYTLDAFMRIVGWGRHAVRAAKKAGLHVRYAQNRAYVFGRDFAAYLDSLDGKGERS